MKEAVGNNYYKCVCCPNKEFEWNSDDYFWTCTECETEQELDVDFSNYEYKMVRY